MPVDSRNEVSVCLSVLPGTGYVPRLWRIGKLHGRRDEMTSLVQAESPERQRGRRQGLTRREKMQGSLMFALNGGFRTILHNFRVGQQR